MHGHVDPHEFLQQISGFLGAYFLALATMNGLASLFAWRSGKAARIGTAPVVGVTLTTAHLWLVVAIGFTILAAFAMGGASIPFPSVIRDFMDWIMGPVIYTLGSLFGLGALFLLRRFFVQPIVAWSLLNLSLLVMGLSMTDVEFAQIVMKPDNVPIVAMVFMLGFFTWLSAYKSVQNDDRIARGEPPLEKLDDEKVLVWPDLVYIELICMVLVTAVLTLWGIGLQAPLEEPASSVKTPNPSKAPWYFLGLQEMLVYYDPWMAGVVLPSLIIVGLMAIPYIDYNKLGNGYYTINQRKFAYVMFQFGFLVLWVTLIVMGTFLRGPNWNFFGPYETWDPHKVEALNNVDLSQYCWNLLGMARPKAPAGSGTFVTIGYILAREAPGFAVLILYLGAGPPALVLYSKFFRQMFVKMGFLRFMVLANLMLLMGLLPLKMLARWTIDLKYFISIPEYFLNF